MNPIIFRKSLLRLVLAISMLLSTVPLSPLSASVSKVGSATNSSRSTTFVSPLPPSTTFVSPLLTPVRQMPLNVSADSSEHGSWKLLYNEPLVALFSGAATYEYPIEAPPGRNGLQPNLSLTYSSRGIDALRDWVQSDWAGLGWNIDTPQIIRKVGICRPANCRSWEPLKFTLLIGGTSYDLVKENSSGAWGRYHTEPESFVYVWRHNLKESGWPNPHTGWDSPANETGEWWVVRLPNGTEYRLGYTANSEQVLKGFWYYTDAADQAYSNCWNDPNCSSYAGHHPGWMAYRWFVDTVTDTVGNTIEYTYLEQPDTAFDSNEDIASYPSDIYYNKKEDGTWGNHLHFTLASRGADGAPNGNGCDPIYMWQNYYLLNIQVYASATLVRQYDLNSDVTVCTQYGGQGDCGQLTCSPYNRILSGIATKGLNGSGPLPQTTFEYASGMATHNGPFHDGNDPLYYPRLKKVNNGYGGSTEFLYSPGPIVINDDWDTAHYRVETKNTTDGLGQPARTEYTYDVPCPTKTGQPCHNPYHDVGPALAGYGQVAELRKDYAGQLVSKTRHTFRVDSWATAGREATAQTFSPSDVVLQQSDSTWLTQTLGVVTWMYFQSATTTRDNRTTQTTYEYDPARQGGAQYGNVTRETKYGDLARSGDEVIVDRQYAPNTTRWIVSKVATETLMSSDGLTQTQMLYAYDGRPQGSPPISGTVTQLAQGMSGWGRVTTTTSYDAWGNPTVVTDTLRRVTRTQYDSTYHMYPVVITNALTQTTRFGYDWARGLVLTATDANNISSYYRHDVFGRLTTLVHPGDSFANPTVSYTYTDGLAPWKIETRQRETSGCANCARSTFEFYDGLGRLIQTRSQAEGAGFIVQSTAYDARGLAVTVTVPYSMTGSAYVTPSWSTLSKSVTAYDALGRVMQVTAPDSTITKHTYKDWRELALDANGHQTQYEKDGLGRLVAVREYYGQYSSPTWNASETPAVTRYWYDVRSNLIGVQDALGNVTRMSYDALGRKVTMDDPSMGHWTYQYDAAGNLITQTNALNQKLVFAYDRLNRVVSKSASGQSLAQYEYDKGTNGIGHRTAMTDTTGVTRWTYDARGRATGESKTISGIGTFATGYAYDAMDRVVTTTYPTNEAVVTTYNKRGLVTGLAGQNVYLTSATYNAQGQPLQQNWGNTRSTSYAYWPGNLRLQQLQVSGSLLDLRYRYDKVGNILAITDTINGGQVQTFGYDARDRLTWARTNAAGSGQYNEGYGYDWMGNIVTRTISGAGQTYAYRQPPAKPYKMFLPIIMQAESTSYGSPPAAATLHQPFAVISTTAGFRATYDANGNMTLRVEMSSTQRITYTQAWNVENCLSVVTNTVSGQVTRFYYDGDGKRVKKVEGGQTTVYVGAHYEKNVTTGVTTTYYYAGSARIAMRQGGVVSYLHGDHLGSTSLTTNASGTKVGELKYTAYGVTRYVWGTTPTDRRFTGQQEQASLGLYDYGARFMSPSLERFISADTIVPSPGNPQSLNRYSYGSNNPLKYTDPTGHCPLCIILGLAAIALLTSGCSAPPTQPMADTPRPLGTPKSDFSLVVSPDFTPQERQWLNAGMEQYATFLGGKDKFEQTIVKNGGLREIKMDRGGTTGTADPNGILTLHDFSYNVNGQPMYMLDETKNQEVAFTKLLWHETTHYLQFAMPDSVGEYVKQTPAQNWYQKAGVWYSQAPGSQRDAAPERMSDAFANTLYNRTYSSRYGVSTGIVLPDSFSQWLLKKLGER